MSTDLYEAAKQAMALCHAPYSKFPVGAAIRAEDGKIYAGANIENLAFPEGWCAETTAISHMVMGGAKQIVEIAVIADAHQGGRDAVLKVADPAPRKASLIEVGEERVGHDAYVRRSPGRDVHAREGRRIGESCAANLHGHTLTTPT